jgi:predicted DNA-binding transcriptional regulator YafY
MNRIDRLFGILLMLQMRPVIRAAEIAARYEISERTVYRDIAALLELGVPIIAQAGEGYSLPEGFYLPPLVFTPSEASALFLGVKMLAASGNLPVESGQVLHKLTAALPGRTLTAVTRQAEIIEFIMPKGQFDLNAPYLADLQTAILQHRLVHLHYHSQKEDAPTERDLEPLALSYSQGAWYVMGYCRLRQDYRSFRLDRVEKVALLRDQFEPRPMPNPVIIPVMVEIRFPVGQIRWVRERQHYGFLAERMDGDQHIIMTYQMQHIREIKNWLLAWGAEAEPLQPPELRQLIREELERWRTLLT